MPRDAIAEVDRPRELRRNAVRVIGQAGEEAADSADGDAKAERDDVRIAGAGADAEDLFGDLHACPSANEPADDRLAFEQDDRVMPACPVVGPRFEPGEDF